MGEILTKTCFSLQSEPHTAKLYLWFLSIFEEIYRELLFLVKNMAISERSSDILRKFAFLNMFEKGPILRKFGFV